MTDDIPIKSVDAIKSYIEMTKKMIERIESGNIRPTDPDLDTLESAMKDLAQQLEGLRN